MKIITVAGARPNFMKVAPIMEELARRQNVTARLVHTGQHYDRKMSKLFFEELQIPTPDFNLEVGSGSHAQQTGQVMQRFEGVVIEEKPDLVLVVGDVNSTIACALTAVKLGIPVGHVEAGLRSFDRSMPEEINRVLTDAIADFLFTTETSAGDNLIREGVSREKIFFVGNVMIDTLLKHRSRAEESTFLDEFGLANRAYGVATLHRPANVDSKAALDNVLGAVLDVAKELPVVFPCHPRTRASLESHGFLNQMTELEAGCRDQGVHTTAPVGYLDFLKLMADAKIVLTDSGGIQEETTILGVPCITMRENTERPITITHGTNILAGTERGTIVARAHAALQHESSPKSVPPLWDGQAARRIADIVVSRLGD